MMRKRLAEALPVPARVPHPDGRVEAELQRVLSMRRAAGRIETRLGDILRTLREVDADRFRHSGGNEVRAQSLARFAEELRGERVKLEAELPALQEELSERLAALGGDAILL
jgi:aminoglycoside phosphotransferase (APT) family kinase protein